VRHQDWEQTQHHRGKAKRRVASQVHSRLGKKSKKNTMNQRASLLVKQQ